MSLTDKYNEILNQEAREQEETEVLRKQYEKYDGCGLGSVISLVESERFHRSIELSESGQNMIKEAVNLIQPGKWNKTRLTYLDSDIGISTRYDIVNGVAAYYTSVSLRSYSLGASLFSPYVKYKWTDGTARYGVIQELPTKIIRGRTSGRREAKQLRKLGNSQLKKLQKILYGNQELVTLSYYPRKKNYYDEIILENRLVLFRDGLLFCDNKNTTVESLETDVFFSATGESMTLEEWLVLEIKRINESK